MEKLSEELRASEVVGTKDVNLGITYVGKIMRKSNKSKRLRADPWEIALHVT